MLHYPPYISQNPFLEFYISLYGMWWRSMSNPLGCLHFAGSEPLPGSSLQVDYFELYQLELSLLLVELLTVADCNMFSLQVTSYYKLVMRTSHSFYWSQVHTVYMITSKYTIVPWTLHTGHEEVDCNTVLNLWQGLSALNTANTTNSVFICKMPPCHLAAQIIFYFDSGQECRYGALSNLQLVDELELTVSMTLHNGTHNDGFHFRQLEFFKYFSKGVYWTVYPNLHLYVCRPRYCIWRSQEGEP